MFDNEDQWYARVPVEVFPRWRFARFEEAGLLRGDYAPVHAAQAIRYW